MGGCYSSQRGARLPQFLGAGDTKLAVNTVVPKGAWCFRFLLT